MLRAKFLSSLEKCFLDESVFDKADAGDFSLLKNERFSFQVCFDREERVPEEIEKGTDPITFEQYPTGAEWLLGLRRRINRMIAQKAIGKDSK